MPWLGIRGNGTLSHALPRKFRLAAFFVLRAILDTVEGGHPLPSILAAMFLLAVQTTLNLIKSYNSGGQFATANVLDSLWN